MSVMRDGWTETTIGEVASINPKEIALAKDAPFVPMDAVKVGKRFVDYFEPRGERSGARAKSGDVLFARITPCLENGKVAQIQVGVGACGGSTEFIVVRGSEIIDSDFIYFWATLESTRDLAAGLMTGTTGRQRLSATDLGEIALNLPPLAEQKRIVDVVSSVDGYNDALQQQADTARSVRNAVLHEMLSAGGDDWTETTLGEVADTRLGKMLSATTDDGSGEMHRYLRNANVRWGKIDFTDLKEMRFSQKDCEVFTLLAGDLLICEGGEPGRAALLKNDLPGIYFQKAIHRVRCKEGLEPGFLAHWMHHLTRTELLDNFLTSTTIKHLTGEKLRQLPVLLPPLNEQRRIMEIVLSMDEAIQATEQAVTDAKSLRSGLLSDLLSGNHEIPASYDSLLGAA